MKKLFVLLVAIMVSSSSLANDTKPAKNVALRSEIVKLLGKVDFTFNNEAKAEVNFLINKKGEIIVVSVESNNTLAEGYIKRKLNYKKVAIDHTKVGRIYKFTVKMVK